MDGPQNNPQNEMQNDPGKDVQIPSLPEKEAEPQPSPPQEHKNNVFRTVLIVFGIFLGLFILLLIFAYIRFRPRLILGSAISNTITSEAIGSKLTIDDFDQNINSLVLAGKKDAEETLQFNIEVTKIKDGSDLEQVTFSYILTPDFNYIKADHNKKEQLLTQLLTSMPELDGSKPLETIKPVMFGDSWFRTRSEQADFEFEMPKSASLIVSTAATMVLDIDSFEKTTVNDLNVFEYKLSMDKDDVIKILRADDPGNEEYYDDEFMSKSDMDKLIKAIEDTKNWENGSLDITVDKRTKTIRKVSFMLPPLGEAPKDEDLSSFLSGEGTLVGYFIDNIISKTHDGTDEADEIISIEVSSGDEVAAINIPDKIVDMEEVDQETKDMSMVIVGLFLLDQEMLEQSYTGSGPFATKVYETRLLFDKGEYEEMLKSANELLELPSNAEEKAIAHYWLGLAHYNLDNLAHAEAALKEAVNLKPDYAGPYVTLAAVEYGRSNFEAGLNYALKCAELDPTYAWCYNNIGLGYLYLDQYEKGIENLEKAVELDPLSFVFAANLRRAKAAGPLPQSSTNTPTQYSSDSGFNSEGQKTVEEGVLAKINDARDTGNNIEIDVVFSNISSKRNEDLSPIRLQMHGSGMGTGGDPQILTLPLDPGQTRSFTFIYEKSFAGPYTFSYGSSTGETVILGTYK